jgi:hypothetical protein
MSPSLLFASLLFLLVSVAHSRPRWTELSEHYSYEQYKQDFGKHYPEKIENEIRQAIFEKNLRTILYHNLNGNSTYHMGVNHLTDWTPKELKSMLGYQKGLGQFQVSERMKKLQNNELYENFGNNDRVMPLSVDWRQKNVVSAVKDQGEKF